MKTVLLIAAAVAATMFATAAPSRAHTTTFSWTTYDAQQRLTIGKFAAANGIKFATCIGTGPATGKLGTFTRKFKHLECTVQDKNLATERQLVVHVRTETGFSAQWLTTKECGG